MKKSCPVYFLLNILNGLCRSIFEPISQAILSDNTSPENKMEVFGYRYVAANIGVAVGPLIGVFLSIKTISLSFFIASIVVLAYGLTIILIAEEKEVKQIKKVDFKLAVNALYNDVSLRYFILAGTLIAIGVSQLETLPLLLKQSGKESPDVYEGLDRKIEWFLTVQ